MMDLEDDEDSRGDEYLPRSGWSNSVLRRVIEGFFDLLELLALLLP